MNSSEATRHFNIRLILVGAAAAFVLFSVLIFVLAAYLPVSHPWLTKEVERMIRDTGADSCSVGSVKTVIYRSITLQNVFIKENIDSDQEYTVSFTEARCSLNLLQFMWNRKKFQASLRSGDTDLFKSFYIKPSNTTEKLLRSRNLLRGVKGGHISNARLLLNRKNGEVLFGSDGEIEFGDHSGNHSENEISIAFPLVKISGDTVENLKCTIVETSAGEVFIRNCTAEYYGGKIKAQGVINLGKNRIDSCKASIDSLDLADWYAVHVGVGKISGTTNIHLNGNNIPLNRLDQQADLQITIAQCVINDLPVQRALATSLFIPSLSSLEFSKVTIHAAVDTGDTITASFAGDGDQIDFSTTGWVRRDGMMEQRVDGIFTGKMLRTLPPIVGKMLEPAGKGGGRFRCRLFGSFNDPRFELDKETLQRAVGTMFNEFKQGLMQQYLNK